MSSFLDECPICLENFDMKTKTIIIFECKHKVHLDCINEWKDEHNNNSYVYKCLFCNENRDIVNILNPIPEEAKINTINNNQPSFEDNIDNDCFVFFRYLGSLFKKIF